MKVSESPIFLEFKYRKTLQEVWNALTVHSEMLLWYFDNIPNFKAEIGFETSFVVNSGSRKFNHLWKVTEVRPLEKLTYSWKYPDYKGDSYVSFELKEADRNVTLQLTVTITEDFEGNIPEFKRESCVEGWNYFLDGRMREFLNREN